MGIGAGNRAYQFIKGRGLDEEYAAVAAKLPATSADPAAILAVVAPYLRPLQTANRTVYVRKDGNNANDGTANSAAKAKLTIQGALDAIAKTDMNSFQVVIQLGDGSYSQRLLIPRMVGQVKTNDLVIRGNTSNPSATIITQTAGYAPTVEAIFAAMVALEHVRIEGTSTGFGINAAEGGVINVNLGVVFGAGGWHMYSNNSGTINTFFGYSIAGGGGAHVVVALCGTFYGGSACTISAAVSFTFAFAAFIFGGAMEINQWSFVNPGNVTGYRYVGQGVAVCNTYGSGASFLPGTLAGYVQTGAQYV